MFNFLHTYNPTPIIFSLGPISIHWYGLLIALGAIAGASVAFFLAKKNNISYNKMFDAAFYLIISALLGARIYYILLELPYYLANPLDVFKVWQGGLAIHGAIIFGLITLYIFAKKNKIAFFDLAGAIAPGLALGQAIGRWGNYFNQELFGWPTNLTWGIPIDIINRPEQFLNQTYFQPAFLYESAGNFIIFIILFSLYLWLVKKNKLRNNTKFIFALYLILYSILRFAMEFIRIDETPTALGLRWPQIASVIIVILAVLLIFKFKKIASDHLCDPRLIR